MKAAFVVFACVLSITIAEHHVLKCYNCIGDDDTCSKEELKKNKFALLPCLGNTCMRIWRKADGKTQVVSSCATKTVCDVAKKACEDDSGDGECAVGCCDTDACNAGSLVSVSVFLVITCSVLGFGLLK